MTDPRPIVALTAGDPAGVGPEIIWRALAENDLGTLVRPVVLGDPTALHKAAEALGLRPRLNLIADPGEGRFEPGVIDLIPCSELTAEAHRFGRSDAACGQAAYRAVVRAVELVRSGKAEALCTAPLAKISLHAAGHLYPGHTELLAELSRAEGEPVMLLAGPVLKVSLVTTHLPLAEAPGALSVEKIVRVIELTAEFGRRLGLAEARVGVCGLNPHAGEEGLFGRQDEEVVAPAVAEARRRGLGVVGPEPADTLFHRAAAGEFDLIVAMYHDQGLAPLKLLHFHEAVNVTLGLPLIRTSVGHGVAFGLAGRGVADPGSLTAALKLAVKLARPEMEIEVWPQTKG